MLVMGIAAALALTCAMFAKALCSCMGGGNAVIMRGLSQLCSACDLMKSWAQGSKGEGGECRKKCARVRRAHGRGGATLVVLLDISPVTKVTSFSRKRALTATRMPI